MLRKTSAAAAVIAFATVGSALFGGAALASDDGGEGAPAPDPVATFTGGDGGEGGDAKTVCFVVGDHTFKAKNTVGDPAATITCSSAGGYGGAGGSGVYGA
jgi:hypothetical protein